MIYSMTAYAQDDLICTKGRLWWEVRSVNHRFFDISYRMPEELRGMEHPLREVAKKIVKRGKLDCTLKFEINESTTQGLDLNLDIAQQVIETCDKLADKMKNPAQLSPMQILNWPQVIQSSEIDWEELKNPVQESFQLALEKLKSTRQHEGAVLGDLIVKRLKAMEEQIKQIKSSLPEALSLQRTRMLDRLSELGTSYDEGRLEQELAFLAQKSDVAEEIDRIVLHIDEVNRVIKNSKDVDGVVGRRLDFLTQELNREANTLGAKAIDNKVSLAAVELKVLIEQIREQVQNIE